MSIEKGAVFDLSLTLVLMVLVLSSCTAITGNYVVVDTGEEEHTFQVEIADEDRERYQGLKYRTQISEQGGMFFVFPDKSTKSFWMKDTYVPLDIIFINEELEVVNIEHAEPCEVKDCPTYESKRPVKYVLEIKGGLAEELGIEKNDKITVSGIDI